MVKSGAQTYAFFAFVCGSSSVRWVSCLDVNIMVDVPMLRTAEEAKMRLPLHCKIANACFFGKHFST